MWETESGFFMKISAWIGSETTALAQAAFPRDAGNLTKECC